ncbi:MAG: class I SAM-dependent methyltransferase [Cyanobacteria bacterium P01_G01_bin.39]
MNNTEISTENRYTDYDPWAWLYNQSEAHLAARRILPIIEKLLIPNITNGTKIFDLCCGTGQLSQELIARGYQVVGLDGSEQMLHYARQNAPKAELILDDARSFELPSNSFDAVICTDSALNHIMSLEELKQVFSNVYSVLQADGLFLFDLGLENRYSNIAVADGEMQKDYAWTVGETYNREEKVGTFTITMFKPDNEKQAQKSNLLTSSIQNLKRVIYNKFLRYIKPAALLKLIKRDWQSSTMKFSVKPHAKTDIQSALAEAGFTAIEIYDSQSKLAKPEEDQEAYFVARKPAVS